MYEEPCSRMHECTRNLVLECMNVRGTMAQALYIIINLSNASPLKFVRSIRSWFILPGDVVDGRDGRVVRSVLQDVLR